MSMIEQHDHYRVDKIRVTQLVQDFHPSIRRRALTSIRTSYPTFFATQTVSNILPVDQSQKLIYQQYNKINSIIDLVDEHIRKRIECYQNQVINVVQKQIEQMREQTGKVVEQFNRMIQQKNKQTEILSLNNQLDYFKNEAKKLFQNNKILNKLNQQLKKQNQQYLYELQNKQIIMQKLLMKYQKEKYYKQKIKQKMNIKLQLIKLQADEQNQTKSNLINQVLKKNYSKNNHKLFNQNINKFSSQSNIKLFNQSINKLSIQSKIKLCNQNNKNQIINGEQQIRQSKNNSILFIQVDEQKNQSNSNMSINASSVLLTQKSAQYKDQSSQANIYLSEYDYKHLFQLQRQNQKGRLKCKDNSLKLKQIAVQTVNYQSQKSNNIEKVFSSTFNNKVNKKQTKNGFYKNQTLTSYKIRNNFFTTSQPKRFIKNTQKILKNNQQNDKIISKNDQFINRVSTEPYSQTQIDLEYGKNDIKICKNINTKYKKMVMKFQSNKIIKKALSRQQFNLSFNC